jgi:hypothetical protein
VGVGRRRPDVDLPGINGIRLLARVALGQGLGASTPGLLGDFRIPAIAQGSVSSREKGPGTWKFWWYGGNRSSSDAC